MQLFTYKCSNVTNILILLIILNIIILYVYITTHYEIVIKQTNDNIVKCKCLNNCD